MRESSGLRRGRRMGSGTRAGTLHLAPHLRTGSSLERPQTPAQSCSTVPRLSRGQSPIFVPA